MPDTWSRLVELGIGLAALIGVNKLMTASLREDIKIIKETKLRTEADCEDLMEKCPVKIHMTYITKQLAEIQTKLDKAIEREIKK